MSRNKEFAEIMTRLTIAFNVQASAARTSIYWEELQNYSIERLKKAASEAIQSCRMFPSVAELIQLLPAPEQPAVLTEPPPTQEELTYGQWQCRFAVWLMGVEKTGTRREPRAPGVYREKSVFKQIGPSRWKEAETQKGRQKLWDEFCQQVDIPERVANVRIN